MPIYEYTCGECETEFELLIRGNETAKCPACESSQVQKQLSVPAAHTSGSKRLPVCEAPPSATCGRPECGLGGCQM